MKVKTKTFILLFVGLQLTAYSLRLSSAQEMTIAPTAEEVKGFVMTIVDKGGREKASVAGKTANILQGGLIEILDVVARIYGQGSAGEDTLVHSSKGLYNKMQNIISTDQFVRINRKDMVITGTGLEWLTNRSRLKINENVRVEYSSDQKAGDPIDVNQAQEVAGSTAMESPAVENTTSLPGGEKRKTIITSRGSGVVNYEKDIAILKKHVVVEDQQATLKAERMKIFFDKENQKLVRVEAYGNVRVIQPKRESTSRKAIYYADEDKVVLTGDPRIVQGLDLYTADKVTIYEKGNRVVFEPKARLVIYAETEHVTE